MEKEYITKSIANNSIQIVIAKNKWQAMQKAIAYFGDSRVSIIAR